MVAQIAAIHESDGLGEDIMQNARDHFHRRSSIPLIAAEDRK
jgi:hypothetical protein